MNPVDALVAFVVLATIGIAFAWLVGRVQRHRRDRIVQRRLEAMRNRPPETDLNRVEWLTNVEPVEDAEMCDLIGSWFPSGAYDGEGRRL